jgi:hypothetical protein
LDGCWEFWCRLSGVTPPEKLKGKKRRERDQGFDLASGRDVYVRATGVADAVTRELFVTAVIEEAEIHA